MRFNFTSARALLMAFSVTLLAAGCGGGGGGDASTAQQTNPPGATNPPPSANNSAPTISGAPPTSATVGQAYSFTPTATDSDGDTLTYSVANQPAWMSINTATGRLTGTPTAAGTFANITISVSDGRGGTANLTGFSLAVSNASSGTSAVTLNWAAPTTNSDGTALTNLSSYKVIYGRDAGNLDQSRSIPSTVNSAVIDNLAPGTWYFAVVAVNAAGTESAPTNVASAAI